MTDTSSVPNSPPSLAAEDPANNDSLPGTFEHVLQKFLWETDDMLPASVVAYDRPSNRVTVQPLIAMVTTLGDIVARTQVVSIPVLQLGGGGFVLSWPIKNGDLGWIKANDKDISNFKATYSMAAPNTARQHFFGDAVFIPDAMKGITLAGEDANNVVLQSLDGTVKIALSANKIKVLTPGMNVTDTTGYTGAAGAILDVQSTSKAFKIPRMTTAQRNAIPSPEGGMMVYVTDSAPPKFSFYTDGTGWS